MRNTTEGSPYWSMKALQPGYLVANAWCLSLGPLAVLALFTLYRFTGLNIFLHGYRAALVSVSVLAFLSLYRYAEQRHLARAVLYISMFFSLYVLAPRIVDAFAHAPREWDFICFYVDGLVAASGLNLYRPESYAEVVGNLGLAVSDEFQREIVEVGFKYPPATALLFLPLSYFDLETANTVWLSFIALAVCVATLLLSRLLPVRSPGDLPLLSILDSIALSAVMVLSIPSTRTAISMGQTTPLLCCLMILTILSRGRMTGGFAASLSVLVKPLAVIPSLALVIGRHWSAVAVGVSTGFCLIAASVLVLGIDDWTSYFLQEYATAAPAWIYYEHINQSLLAALCRSFGFTEVPWTHWPIASTYFLVSLAFVVPSLWLSRAIVREDFRTAYCLLLLMALIVYPGTQITYGMALSIPLAVEFWNQYKAREHELVAIAFVVVTVMLSGYSLFAANVFVWCVFVRRSLIVTAIADSAVKRSAANAAAY